MHGQAHNKIRCRRHYFIEVCCVVQVFSFCSVFFFRTPHLNHVAVRRNMCVIVSPSACFIVHTTTSEELPLISGVSESPQHHHLLPAAFLNAFLLRAALCSSDSRDRKSVV